MSQFGDLISLSSILILPARCLVCQAPLSKGELCRHCRPDLLPAPEGNRCTACSSEREFHAADICSACSRFPSPFFRQRYLWNYEGKARNLIVALKYQPSMKLARLSARLLSSQLDQLFGQTPEWDLIVPMPSSPGNYARRLFNPAAILAQSVGAVTGTPVVTDALFHTSRSLPQASQNDRRRIRNALLSLHPGRKELRNGSVLLIDDVVTTGATGAVAARLLLLQGAGTIELLSLARAGTWSQHRSLVSRFIYPGPAPCST